MGNGMTCASAEKWTGALLAQLAQIAGLRQCASVGISYGYIPHAGAHCRNMTCTGAEVAQ